MNLVVLEVEVTISKSLVIPVSMLFLHVLTSLLDYKLSEGRDCCYQVLVGTLTTLILT